MGGQLVLGGGTNFGQSLCLNWIHSIPKKFFFNFNIENGGKVKKIRSTSLLKCHPEVLLTHNLLGFTESLFKLLLA